MARTLDVYLYNELVGHLVQDDGGQMTFGYSGSWLQKPNPTPLSQSLPLRTKRFTRKECRGFFAGLLPEEGQREVIARNLGISARNDYAMLEQIGGECAGAVTFIPAGQNFPERRRLPDALLRELAAIREQPPKRPPLAGGMDPPSGRRPKVAVRIEGNEISATGGAPSTHILKPAVDRFAGVASNEAFQGWRRRPASAHSKGGDQK
jgi:serine/threonine-protein kinase HipA